MRALVWSRGCPYTAGKPGTARGQYRIWQDPGPHFRVLHRSSATGALSEWCDIGESDDLDRAKAIAQAHVEPERENKSIFVLLARFDDPDDATHPNEIWAFTRQAAAESFLRGWSKDYLGGFTHAWNDLPADAELVAAFRNAGAHIHLYECHPDGGSDELVPFARVLEPQPQQ